MKRAIIASLFLVSGCAGLLQFARAVPTILDIARDLCIAAGSERTGLDVEEVATKFCETEEQLRPWVGLARETMETGAVQTGMSKPTCDGGAGVSDTDCL